MSEHIRSHSFWYLHVRLFVNLEGHLRLKRGLENDVFFVWWICVSFVYMYFKKHGLFFSLSPKHKFQLCPTFQLFTTYPPLGWPVRSVYSKLSHQIITMVAIIVILWCESVEYTASLTNLEMRHKDVPTQLWWRTFCLKYNYGWSVWWTTGNQQHLFARH